MGFQIFWVERNGVFVSCCLADFLDSLSLTSVNDIWLLWLIQTHGFHIFDVGI